MTEVISLLQACKAAAAQARKSRPELMVFNEAPLKRAGAPVTKAEPSIFARPKEAEALGIADELSLEDLVMDVRPEAPLAPLRPAPRPAPAQTQPLKRMSSTQSRRQPRQSGLVFLALAAAGVLGVVLVRSAWFRGPARDHVPAPANTFAAPASPDLAEKTAPERAPVNPRRPQPPKPSPDPGQAVLVPPANPLGAAEVTAPVARADTGKADIGPRGLAPRMLPPGFRAKVEAGLHQSGWPLVIVGDHDRGPMVLIPGGAFTMGSDHGDPVEAPAHTVRLSTFYIDQYEVTNRQFRTFLDDTALPWPAAGQLAHGGEAPGLAAGRTRGLRELPRRRDLRPLGRQASADRGAVGDGRAGRRTDAAIPGATSRPNGRGLENSNRSTRS